MNVAHGLILSGRRVLLVDLDPQGQCATILGLMPEPGAFNLLVADLPPAQVVWQRALPGLAVQGAVVHESDRIVLPDNSARIPSYTRTDAAARYTQRVAGTTLTWRIGVDNVFDERAWKESPYQFGHVYLFPLAPRTWRASLQADF